MLLCLGGLLRRIASARDKLHENKRPILHIQYYNYLEVVAVDRYVGERPAVEVLQNVAILGEDEEDWELGYFLKILEGTMAKECLQATARTHP